MAREPQHLRLAAALLLCGTITGCAGGGGAVHADRSKFPVSFSGSIPDSTGRALSLGNELEQVGTFETTSNSHGFIYSATTSAVDLSDEIDRQVVAAKGQGIARLELSVDHCALNFFFPLNHLPFWPGCASVTAKGAIVRLTPKQAGQ